MQGVDGNRWGLEEDSTSMSSPFPKSQWTSMLLTLHVHVLSVAVATLRIVTRSK